MNGGNMNEQTISVGHHLAYFMRSAYVYVPVMHQRICTHKQCNVITSNCHVNIHRHCLMRAYLLLTKNIITNRESLWNLALSYLECDNSIFNWRQKEEIRTFSYRKKSEKKCYDIRIDRHFFYFKLRYSKQVVLNAEAALYNSEQICKFHCKISMNTNFQFVQPSPSY